MEDGTLTFTGGLSDTWYPSKEFERYVFPSASVTVTPLTENEWEDGFISTTASGQLREQWFSFTATAATQYIHLKFGTLSDLYIQVYNDSGTTVGAETNIWGLTNRISRPVLIEQIYYIRIRPYTNLGNGTYQIAFNTGTTAPN